MRTNVWTYMQLSSELTPSTVKDEQCCRRAKLQHEVALRCEATLPNVDVELMFRRFELLIEM